MKEKIGFMPFDSEYQPDKGHMGHFVLALTVCKIFIFLTFDLAIVGHGQGNSNKRKTGLRLC